MFSSSVGLLHFFILSCLIVFCFLRPLFPFSAFFQTLSLYLIRNQTAMLFAERGLDIV